MTLCVTAVEAVKSLNDIEEGAEENHWQMCIKDAHQKIAPFSFILFI